MREAIAICQSLPGPLAIQVGIFISYLRGGFWGAWAGGWAFILPNFVIVAALGALYVYLGDLQPVTAIFYGVSPAVIALILHSCYRLAKLGMEDWLQWAIAGVCFVVTVVAAGRSRAAVHRRRHRRDSVLRLAASRVAPPTHARRCCAARRDRRRSRPSQRLDARQAAAVLPEGGFADLRQRSRDRAVPGAGLVQQYGWLDERQFLIAVAIGMISPGPVVITATFVGYLVAGFWGSLVSTIGIFLPSFLLVLIVAPILARHRGNANVQGFVKGAYAAAIGTILGACILLGKIAIGDWLTALIARRVARRPVPLEGQQSPADCGDRGRRPDRLPIAAAGVGDDQVTAVMKGQGDDSTTVRRYP